MRALVRNAISDYIDPEAWKAQMRDEDLQRESIPRLLDLI